MRKDLVCTECGKPLRECPPEKPSNWKRIAVIAAIVLAVICVLLLVFNPFSGGNTTKAGEGDTVTTVTDSIKEEPVDTAKAGETAEVKGQENTEKEKEKEPEKEKEEKPQKGKEEKPIAKVSQTLNLGYATFAGPVKNGKPNGMGRMTFKTAHIIDKRDMKERMAEAGDYVVGEWKDGKLVQGRWFDSSNTVKGAIIIGM